MKFELNGAEGRTRTDTRLPLLDFESSASTSSHHSGYMVDLIILFEDGALSET